MKIPKEHRIIAFAQFITVVGLLILSLSYYHFPSDTPEPDGYRFIFDIAFPLADAILAVVLCLAGYSLLKGRNGGRLLSLIGALCLIYLGVLDVGIPYNGSVYAVSIIDISANGAVNLWCVVLGLYTVLKLRKRDNIAE